MLWKLFLNDLTLLDDEADITFGKAKMKTAVEIYNYRIGYRFINAGSSRHDWSFKFQNRWIVFPCYKHGI